MQDIHDDEAVGLIHARAEVTIGINWQVTVHTVRATCRNCTVSVITKSHSLSSGQADSRMSTGYVVFVIIVFVIFCEIVVIFVNEWGKFFEVQNEMVCCVVELKCSCPKDKGLRDWLGELHHGARRLTLWHRQMS